MKVGKGLMRIGIIVVIVFSIFTNLSYGEKSTIGETLNHYLESGLIENQLIHRNTLLRFQAENNLNVDGIYGPNTEMVLKGNVKAIDIIPEEVLNDEWFIVINKTKKILTVYNKGKIYRKYPVALGKSTTQTPNHKFTIINKVIDPYWGGMGGKYKPVKGGDPKNPLGKRWLGLSTEKYTGYGIHGNSDPFSIGKYISHGCVRMINEDVEEMFQYIPIKTKVWVGDEEILIAWGIKQYYEEEQLEEIIDKNYNIGINEIKEEGIEEMKDILDKLPKIELHCHLDGSVRPETMYELLLQQGEIEKLDDINDFKELVSVKDECQSLKEYLEKFSYPLKVMQNEENIERITFELLEDLNKENVKYVEIRFAPFLHMSQGLTFDEVVESVLRGMERAKSEYNILSNGILICMRHEPVENSIEVVNQGEKYLGKGIVAVDLAGNEHDFPPEIHKEAFDLAYEKGFNITIHGGETGIVENISKSIELLHAKRIGHGIAAIKDLGVMELLKEKNIFLEMCPTSNFQTKAVDIIQNYPLRTYMDFSIGVTINTDNTTVSNTNLAKEYRLLMEKMDFTLDEISKLIYNGVEASFLSLEEKEDLRNLILVELKSLGL